MDLALRSVEPAALSGIDLSPDAARWQEGVLRDSTRQEALMTLTLYGIKTCDTVAKARRWLDDHSRTYVFHDYKAAGVDRARLETWVAEHGWEVVLNRAGTTFRKLPDADRLGVDASKAVDLMLAQPSMIKRPILDLGERRLVGFKPDLYAAALG